MTNSDQSSQTVTADSGPTGPLQLPAFRWYFTGVTVSLFGSAMAPVALAFAVLDYSQHAADLGWVLAARSVPLVVFLLVGGAIADRFSRGSVLRLANLGAAATQGIVAYLLLTQQYNLWLIILLELVNGTLTAFTQPAMRGIVPQLVPRPLTRQANSLLGSVRNAVTIAGPTVAGVVVAVSNGGWAIAVDALTFLVAALCMSRLRLPAMSGRARTVMRDIREGWTEFRSMTWVWMIVASLCVTNFLKTGVWSVLGPIIAQHTVGAAGWGLVLSSRAVGLLVMSMLMYRLVVHRMLGFGQLCLALGAAPLIVLGLEGRIVGLAVAAFLAGLGSGVFGPAWETSLQEHVPNAVLSRVSSYDDVFSYLAVPAGMLMAAPMGAAFGNERVALAGGLLFLTAVLLPLLSPAVRGLRHGLPAPHGGSQ